MPAYFYHIKLELYSTPTPEQIEYIDHLRGDSGVIWLPPSSASIFDSLPSHPFSTSQSKTNRENPQIKPPWEEDIIIPRESSRSDDNSLLDCGITRGSVAQNTKAFKEREVSKPIKAASGASSDIVWDPKSAIRDWRFGSVSIETIDPCPIVTMASGESSRAGAAAAPTLGPNYFGSGTSTKAEYVPVGARNTNIGWGVVHFYRDDQETRALELPEQGEEDEVDLSTLDCTTLCIPAVPAYMSPGDLLGFIGERWHSEISHCRLVMTSKISRYLVLLKFRSNRSAKEWKRNFDGKPFNTMEVRLIACILDNVPALFQGTT